MKNLFAKSNRTRVICEQSVVCKLVECTKYDVCFAWFVLVGNNCIELYDILTGPFEQFPFDFAGLMINNLDVLE